PSAGAATVLRTCGRGAPAEWWAQVVTRLSGRVRGVVVDPVNAPSAIRKLRAAGREWAPPALKVGPGSTTLTFFTIEYERGVPYEVVAKLPSRGELTVELRELTPPKKS
ncbi:hypothetical protein L6R52_32230, partial [Myxococcota bacterium]|nr:hypothetical protein [Myxococcota bacterium]